MKVVFDPPRDTQLVGTVSVLAWDHPALRAAIVEAFGTSQREEITELHVTESGLQAKFEGRPGFVRKTTA